MQSKMKLACLAAAGLIGVVGCAGMQSGGPKSMTFFVTSTGPGKGGDLGGLEGADRHCQSLAQAAGAGERTWRAYLSTQAPSLNNPAFVNARDRIGAGPWQNAKGEVIARNVDDLHSASSNLTKQTALDEKGQPVNSRTETPSQARHAHRLATRRDRLPGNPIPGHDLRQLDEGRGRWLRDDRPFRSRRPHRHSMGDVLEFQSPDAWLQSGAHTPHGRGWPVLLFCGEVIRADWHRLRPKSQQLVDAAGQIDDAFLHRERKGSNGDREDGYEQYIANDRGECIPCLEGPRRCAALFRSHRCVGQWWFFGHVAMVWPMSSLLLG